MKLNASVNFCAFGRTGGHNGHSRPGGGGGFQLGRCWPLRTAARPPVLRQMSYEPSCAAAAGDVAVTSFFFGSYTDRMALTAFCSQSRCQSPTKFEKYPTSRA